MPIALSVHGPVEPQEGPDKPQVSIRKINVKAEWVFNSISAYCGSYFHHLNLK